MGRHYKQAATKTKRSGVKKSSDAKPSKLLRERARKYKVRVTRKVNGKRVYKTPDEILIRIAQKKRQQLRKHLLKRTSRAKRA